VSLSLLTVCSMLMPVQLRSDCTNSELCSVCVNMSWLLVNQKSKSFIVHGLQCTRTCAMK